MGGGLKREEELINFLSLKRKGGGLLERGGLFEWGAGWGAGGGVGLKEDSRYVQSRRRLAVASDVGFSETCQRTRQA